MVNSSSCLDRVEEMREEIEAERSQDPDLPDGDLETVADLALDEGRQEDYRGRDLVSRRVAEDEAIIYGRSQSESVLYSPSDVVDCRDIG